MGGVFSPLSLNNALINKNPLKRDFRFTTSNPYFLGVNIQVEEKNMFLYALNATFKSVDIQRTDFYRYSLSYGFWEMYDFDFMFGSKLLNSKRASLIAMIGIGAEKRFEYANDTYPRKTLKNDTVYSVELARIEIKPVKLTPIYICLNLQASLDLTRRVNLFFILNSNFFITRNYSLNYTLQNLQGTSKSTNIYSGDRFSNNSIFSGLGFRINFYK